jgi:hypothetical protein
MSKQVMEQALEALQEYIDKSIATVDARQQALIAIAALKEAIKQQDEPSGWACWDNRETIKQQCEPVAKVIIEGGADYDVKLVDLVDLPVGEHLLYTSTQAPTIPAGWTQREIELFDGMIESQESHAAWCDSIQNRTMATKQKGWDLERVALLKKCKGDKP